MQKTFRKYEKEEFARRGDAIYEEKIKPLLKAKDKGKYIAIDIETGEYEIDDNELTATHRMQARFPNPQIWMVRVGYRYLRHFGGRKES